MCGCGQNVTVVQGGPCCADWDEDLVRFWIVDNDNGNDSRVGFIDAAPGTVFTPAETGPVAIRTLTRLRELMPRVAPNHMTVVLIAPRADEGNYLNPDDDPDFLDRGYWYKYIAFRGSDLTNSTRDKVVLGQVIAEAGPNGDDSWTVSAYADPVITNAAGVLPAQNTVAGLSVVFTGNVTAGLLTQGSSGHIRISDTELSLGFGPAPAPVNGDTYWLMRPGVKVTQFVGQAVGLSANDFISTAQGAVIAGIETTAAMEIRDNNIIQFASCRTTGSFTWEGGNAKASGNYLDETGTFIINGAGIDCRGSAIWTDMSRVQVNNSSWHGSLTLRGIFDFALGEACFSNSAPSISYVGSGNRENDAVQFSSGLGTFNTSPKPGFFLPAGITLKAVNINIGGLHFGGPATGVTMQGENYFTIRDLRGTVTTTVLSFAAAQKNRGIINEGSFSVVSSGAGEIIYRGKVGNIISVFDDLGFTNSIDMFGNELIGSAGRLCTACIECLNTTGGGLLPVRLMRADAAFSSGRPQLLYADGSNAAGSTQVLGPSTTTTPDGQGCLVAIAGNVALLMDSGPALTPGPGCVYVNPAMAAEGTRTVPAVAGTNQKLRLGQCVGIAVSGQPIGIVAWHPESFPAAADGAG